MKTEDAIKKINEVHSNKYVLPVGWTYKNAREDICLYCPKHGEFHKDFYRLVNMKQGCPVCSRGSVYKSSGYWNNYENCMEEAMKYHNKYQLQRGCNSCYQGMVRNGWLDIISQLVFDNKVKYMQYDEKVNCVYVYEFTELKTFYVGRTNGLKRRDRQHRNGYGHKNGSREYDAVFKFASENMIEIPSPIILEEGLSAEDSQIKEDEWKNRYIELGWHCLNKAATGKGRGSLGATLKWTYDKCKEESKKYKSKYEMKKKCQSAYSSAVKNKWIDEFFNNLKKDDNYWDVKENVLEAARNSYNARDMIKRFGGAYNSARKNGWTKLLEYGKKKEDDR